MKMAVNDWENRLNGPNSSKSLLNCPKMSQNVTSCPKMSQNVPKCPFQTHRCPNGLVLLRINKTIKKQHITCNQRRYQDTKTRGLNLHIRGHQQLILQGKVDQYAFVLVRDPISRDGQNLPMATSLEKKPIF